MLFCFVAIWTPPVVQQLVVITAAVGHRSAEMEGGLECAPSSPVVLLAVDKAHIDGGALSADDTLVSLSQLEDQEFRTLLNNLMCLEPMQALIAAVCIVWKVQQQTPFFSPGRFQEYIKQQFPDCPV